MTQFALSTIFSIRYRLLRYAPTNILLIRTHGRHGLRWFLLAVGLAAMFFYAAAICTTILNHDGPGWLNALVILHLERLQDASDRPGDACASAVHPRDPA